MAFMTPSSLIARIALFATHRRKHSPKYPRAMKLVQRREVWLPTPWGWLALLSAAAGLAIALVASLYPFLAVTDPAGGARVLVVEGWLGPHELDEALAILHRGRYARVLTTGGPLHTWPESAPDATYAHRAADYLKRHGAIGVTPVPSPI